MVFAALLGAADAVGMLVTGEAGVGKSRLVSTAMADAERVGVLVLSSGCVPHAKGLPLLPVADVVRSLISIDTGRLFRAALSACPSFVGSELARLVPAIEDNEAVVIERPRWNLTLFKVHFGLLTLKAYTKGEHVLRF